MRFIGMSKFIHERTDFKQLIEALSSEIKIDTQLIEKDYWIMHALWGMNQLGFEYELKGGTSLSKGWKCIDRFSEDIDIYIHPPKNLNLPVGKNHTKDAHIEARKNYFESLVNKLKIAGFVSVQRDTVFDDKKHMRNAGIRLSYPNLFGQIPGLKDGILLEVGFDQTTPNEEITISSWVIDKAISVKLDVINNQAVRVKCYVPEYTFVEKLQTISTKFRQQQENGQIPINFMRHYYDVFQLLKLKRVQEFIGSEEYLVHKELRFREADEKDLWNNDAFTISNFETQKLYQQSFERTKGLYYKGQPMFRDILEAFKVHLQKM